MITSVLPTYNRAPLSFVKGEGVWLMEAGGERYLDLGAGIAVNVLGHANPALTEVLSEQAHKLWHTSNLYIVPRAAAAGRSAGRAYFRRHGILHQFRDGSGGTGHQDGAEILV